MNLSSHEVRGAAAGPHLLITGGVHGDEFEPMAAVRRLIAEIPTEILAGRVTLVPVVNEPAFRRGHRAGEDGLDLARTCPGKENGSVTEQIAFALSALIRSADFYIDLHTGGTRLMVLPLVGYTLHANPRVLEVQRRMARAFGLPLIWGTDPNLEGRSLSIARDADVPAIYAEYLGGGRCEPAGIEAYVAGCLNVMCELGMLPSPNKRLAQDLPPHVIEDTRSGSGHMQVNHPTPCEGFFEPHVALGHAIAAGDLLGTVTDLLGRHVALIQSRYTGTVIVLHAFSRVDEGTSVAVVLETT